ncbi:PilZ domain-containing protein [Sinobacterium caligoides]|uniref:PilZ domain-containing protein n=1 Tax=Sinobacterium caligoides TaxID=933926 RepID=A0A3N2DNT5_9GAMM|nr:PilZ domain-containing protein [Sinobacterium caligoides]ROS00985.1 PilZ domain-containing protein [Sinobacterium caligoides]
MSERRRDIRRPFKASVEVCIPGYGDYIAEATDISEGGLFVRTGRHPLPPLRAEITVRMTGGHGETIPVQVVRHQGQGMGLMFLH